VGSTGRYRDFDLGFSPRHKRMEDRWTDIANASYRGADLPPVLLYKVGDVYLVEDGNHRISVARTAGEQQIAAHVIEIDSSSLVPERSCQRLGFKIPGDAHRCHR